MASQPLSALYSRIRPKVLKASIPEVDIAIREAARELCIRSTVWRDSISVDIQAGLPEYALVDTDTQAEVVDIEAAQYNVPLANCPIPMVATSPEYVNDAISPALYPNNFFLDPPSRIVIGPVLAITQDVPAGLWVRVVLLPIAEATRLDSGLLQRADQAIVDGALSRLLSTNNTPWFNTGLAAYHRKAFEIGLAKAKTAAELGFQKTNLQTAVFRF